MLFNVFCQEWPDPAPGGVLLPEWKNYNICHSYMLSPGDVIVIHSNPSNLTSEHLSAEGLIISIMWKPGSMLELIILREDSDIGILALHKTEEVYVRHH